MLTKPVMPKIRKPRGIPYRQCVLRKKTEGGYAQQVSYIPAEFAKVEGVVRLKQDDGSWDDGWQVMSAGPEVDEVYLDALYGMWRHHAEVSDMQRR